MKHQFYVRPSICSLTHGDRESCEAAAQLPRDRALLPGATLSPRPERAPRGQRPAEAEPPPRVSQQLPLPSLPYVGQSSNSFLFSLCMN